MLTAETGATLEVPVGLCRENSWLAGSKRSDVRGQEAPKLIGPKDVKTKREGWWCAIGREDIDLLEGIKRVRIGVNKQITSISIIAPMEPGTYTYTVYLLSDCYMGLDQEVRFTLHVTPGADYVPSTIDLAGEGDTVAGGGDDDAGTNPE